MLGSLGAVLNSEYNNAGDLMGLGEIDNELLGALAKMNPIQKAKALNAVTKKPIPSKGSRAEMEKFFSELPAHIKDGLLKGNLRLSDTIIYTIKPVSAQKTVKMFESQDTKETGLRNIDRGRLPKNMALLVSGVILLQGVAASAATDDVKSANYTEIDDKGALATGEITLKHNKKSIIAQSSVALFRTTGYSMVPRGYYKLDNPRVIQDDVEIECEIELGSTTGIAANTYFYLGLHGTVTIP
jgi:hypothetical protein